MDRAATMPGTRPKVPKASDLTPEELDALMAEGWTAADDGSLTPPGQNGGMPKAFDYDAGGFAGALGGVPATTPPTGSPAPPGGPAPTGAPADTPKGTLPDPLKPGDPSLNARIEITNPMKDALPEPFDVPEVTPMLRAQPAPDLKAAASSAPKGGGNGGYQGRVGRRRQQASSTGRVRSRRR